MSKPHTGPARPADRLHLLPRHREMLLALLQEHLPGIEVWAYGSRVNGQSHDGSDLDLVLRSPDLQEIPIGRVGDFREALQESNIPFLVEARDWARLPKGFHREIERGYVVLVEKEDGNTAGKRQEVALGELVEIYDGPHATPKKTDAGPIFLGISNLASGRLDLGKTEHLSEEDYKRWTQRVTPEPGDTVFSYETRLGEAAHIPTGLRCCLGRRMGLLRPKDRRIDARFLLYAFLGERFQEVLRSRTIHGSTVNRIPLTEMGSFPIAIPTDLSEQRAIAHILGTLDDKIELNRRMNETLEAMTRALFKSWFVDFDPVHAKAALKHHAANQIPRQGDSTRSTKAAPSDHSPLEGESARQGRQPAVEPVGGNQTPLLLLKGGDWTAKRAQAYLDGMEAETAALFPESFAASELGPIPAGWELQPLAECIDVARGLSYQGSKLAATGLPMHNLNSIYEGGGYKQAGIKYYAGDFKARHTTLPGEKFAENLKRELPRLPFAPDFRAFAAAGKQIARLHLEYESLEPYDLQWIEADDVPLSQRVERMKLSKDKTALVVNDSLTLAGIPPDVFSYRLGNRSALEWVIDQYRIKTDKRSGIRSDPNRLDDEAYIVRLVGQVVRLSLETVSIVAGLPAELGGMNPPRFRGILERSGGYNPDP